MVYGHSRFGRIDNCNLLKAIRENRTGHHGRARGCYLSRQGPWKRNALAMRPGHLTPGWGNTERNKHKSCEQHFGKSQFLKERISHLHYLPWMHPVAATLHKGAIARVRSNLTKGLDSIASPFGLQNRLETIPRRISHFLDWISRDRKATGLGQVVFHPCFLVCTRKTVRYKSSIISDCKWDGNRPLAFEIERGIVLQEIQDEMVRARNVFDSREKCAQSAS